MSTEPISVRLRYTPEASHPVGRLALDGNATVFEYDPAFAGLGFVLNPALGAPGPGLLRPPNPRAFAGLHGVFADSLPDAWGELVLRRRLGIAYPQTVLERLLLVGSRGRGALIYEPAREDAARHTDIDLDALARDAASVLTGSATDVAAELARFGGSSGGARPKVQIALDERNRARGDDANVLPAGYTAWIVKFRATFDRFADIGPLEAAYAIAATNAGIDMPRTRLIEARSGPGYFATERFDRTSGGGRRHMLSLAGAMESDWTIPEIDYTQTLAIVRNMTRDESDVVEMFRRMAFNVVAHNRDDHAKQHAFLFSPHARRFRLAPAYDLTLSHGPGNEHYLAINGKGRDITRADLLAVAATQAIKPRIAEAAIDRVIDAVSELPKIAKSLGVSRETRSELKRTLEGTIAPTKRGVSAPKK